MSRRVFLITLDVLNPWRKRIQSKTKYIMDRISWTECTTWEGAEHIYEIRPILLKESPSNALTHNKDLCLGIVCAYRCPLDTTKRKTKSSEILLNRQVVNVSVKRYPKNASIIYFQTFVFIHRTLGSTEETAGTQKSSSSGHSLALKFRTTLGTQNTQKLHPSYIILFDAYLSWFFGASPGTSAFLEEPGSGRDAILESLSSRIPFCFSTSVKRSASPCVRDA